MFPQQRAQLILKRYLPMVFFLAYDIMLHLLQIRMADGKIRITTAQEGWHNSFGVVDSLNA